MTIKIVFVDNDFDVVDENKAVFKITTTYGENGKLTDEKIERINDED